MKPNLYFCIFAVYLGLGLGQSAMAQGSTVTSRLVAQRVEMVDGKAVVKPAGEGKPGEIIEYSGTYRNGGTAAVDKLLATIPVPDGTSYIAGSSNPASAQASTDGTHFAPVPLIRTVRQSDGSERKEPVPLSDYRAVRWEVGTLLPGSSSAVSLRVRIDAPPAAGSAAKP
jgi:uncharacterized repeat protein (TIGR01451 family)